MRRAPALPHMLEEVLPPQPGDAVVLYAWYNVKTALGVAVFMNTR